MLISGNHFTMMSNLKPPANGALKIFFYLLFLSGGISPDVKYKWVEIPYSIFINCAFFIEILGCVVGFCNTPELECRIEILLQVLSHVYFNCLHWVLKLNRDHLQLFIRYFYNTDQHIPADYSLRINQLTVIFFNNSMKVVLTVFCFFLVLIASISLITPLLADFNFDDKYIYVMPFWFVCSAQTGKNRFPVPFLCWNVDTFHKYALVNGIVVFLFSIELFAYLTTFSFFCFTQAHLKAHLRVILKRIEKLAAHRSSQYLTTHQVISLPMDVNHVFRPPKTVPQENDNFFVGFVEIIRHYQYLKQVANSILKFLRWTVTVSLAGFICVQICSLFLFITEAGKTGELLFKFKMGSVAANATVMFFLYCHGAEVTTHVNEDISNAIYNMPWDTSSIKFRKTVITFLIYLQKNLGISAFWVYKLNLYFFMRCLRTVYSILNVMLVSVK